MRDRVVLVTGGTGALGAAVALGALEAGATTVVTYRDARDRDALAGRAPLPARERLHGVQADVTDGESVRRLVDEVAARHRRLDALVNAVGAFAAGDLLATDERAWDAMLSREPPQRLPLLPRGAPRDAERRPWPHRQRRVPLRRPARRGLHRLHGGEGRGDRADPGARPGGPGTRRHRQRRLAQHDGHRGEPARHAGRGPARLGDAGDRWRGRSCSWRATPPPT